MAHFLGDYFWGNFVWFSSLVGRSGGSRSCPVLGERTSPTSETGWWGGMPGNRTEFTDRSPARWMGFPDIADNGVPGERYLGLFWGIKKRA